MAKPEQIVEVSMDMSPAFVAAVGKTFPKAKITFDRFHVVKLLNEAMDTVRKLERREHEALKGHEYTFLEDWDRLSDKQRQELVKLMEDHPTLGAAYRLEALFNDLWAMPNIASAEAHLTAWTEEVQRAGIQPFVQFAKRRARGYRNIRNFIDMACFLCGKLDFSFSPGIPV